MKITRLTTPAAALVVSMLLASCSFGTESSANRLGDDRRIEVGGPDDGISRPVEPIIVYLIRGDDVVSRPRLSLSPLNPQSIIDSLASGLSEFELANDLRSSLSISPLVIENARLNSDVAEISVSSTFLDLAGSEQRLLLAQVVLSLFKNLNISSVRVLSDDVDVAVPGASGEVLERPLVVSDYSSLIGSLT
ncbi:MAG: hypothetical protein ACO3WI_00335 [Ilumatobacteraceae bacterium]